MKQKLYLGIDVGGTDIKGGIIDANGKIILSEKVKSETAKGEKKVTENIANLCRSLMEKEHLTKEDIPTIGIGIAGTIDSEKGEVVYSNNLGWSHYSLGKELEAILGQKTILSNDANVACLGEYHFGSGKNSNNVVLLTLGTGVGGGLVLNGKLFEGNKGAGAELGHMVIVAKGRKCTCGQEGCLEAYASATALIKETKKAIDEHPESLLAKETVGKEINAKTPFDFKDKDPYAKKVIEDYLLYLGIGVTNLANIFRPDCILLGGGVSAQKENLTRPLQEYLDAHIFGKDGPHVVVKTATLGNDAGIIGAASLCFSF